MKPWKPAEKRLVCTVWGAGFGLLFSLTTTAAVLEFFPEFTNQLIEQYRPFQTFHWVMLTMLAIPAGIGGVLGAVIAWKATRPADDRRMPALIRAAGVGATVAMGAPLLLEAFGRSYFLAVVPVLKGSEFRWFLLLILAGSALGALVGIVRIGPSSPIPLIPADVDMSTFQAKNAAKNGDDQITKGKGEAVTRNMDRKVEEERGD